MEPWSIGLVAVIVIGLAIILYGGISDRARNRRAEAEMLAPPQRSIPHFQPDAPAPQYLSELQARRPVDTPTAVQLTAIERDQLAGQLKDPTTVTIDAGYVTRDFISDPGSGQAVLEAPRVLVCADPVNSLRELLGILEKLILSQTPLVVVAPALSEEVRCTLEVNQIRHTMSLLAVTPANAADLQRAADATGAAVRTRSDLQAGYVWPEHLGSCARWVSNSRTSFIIGSGG